MNKELLRLKEDLLNQLENKFKNNRKKFVASISQTKKEGKRIAELTSFIDEVFEPTKKSPSVAVSYRLYCVLNNMFSIEDLPKCEICGKVRSFKGFTEGFNMTCGSRSCCQKHPSTNKKKQETAIKVHGFFKSGLL